MKPGRATRLLPAVPVCLSLLIAPDSLASNGMNMIGYGARSCSMAGADLAIADGPSAMNINPAGIGRGQYRELALGLSEMRPSVTHADRLGNDGGDVLDRYPIPFLGYIHPLGRITLGAGFFVQGGMGAEYEDLSTPFSVMAASAPAGFFDGDVVPAGDAALSSFMHAKFTPTVAWRVTETLIVGAGVNVSYARAAMKLFPGTSVVADLDGSGTAGDSPGDAFFGMDARDMSDIAYGLRLGLQYQVGSLRFGGGYCTRTSLDLDGGTTTLNLSAQGLGEVDYDARMTGFAWPRTVNMGMAYQVSPRVLLVGDVDWVNWSNAIETITIEIDNPDHPMAPASREIPMAMDWNDQWVFALGMEVMASPTWALRFGYNHGKAPVPDSRLRPMFPAIAEDHIAGGVGKISGPWTFDVGLEYAIENEMTNDSPDRSVNPFGSGSRESVSQFMVHFMVRRTLSLP